ncbi:ABC transporter ATP-binding protein [Sulfurospirillum arcachonense]|uniref:ABC transporter ATP-binding protein n=1 Tax=Sulfurospirillum arcachonense TaxID=57666 RepID=UPI000469F0AB|nr:ABC transporter ATP-binding protein [Sulfurospirillum arcachonense]
MEGLKLVLKRFSPYFKDYISYFILAIIGMILASSGTAASAYLVKPLLDDIFVAKDMDMLNLLPYAIIAVYVAKESGRYMQSYCTSYIGHDIIRRFRNKILNNLLIQDISFFHKYRTGELISRNTNDVERVRTVVSNIIPEFFRDTFTIVGLVSVVIYQNSTLAFYALVVLPLAILPLGKLAKKMKNISKKSQEKISDITAKLSEIFNNIEVIQANSAMKYETDIFANENKNYFNLTMKSVKVSQLVSPMMEIFGSIGVATVIIIGGRQVINDTMTMGAFFSFLTALFMLYTPIKKLSTLYNKLQEAIAASERIFFLLDYKPTITGGEKEIPQYIKNLEFTNVKLQYGEKKALNGISFKANHGEFMALVGDSGGGKSSLVNMIIRFFDPNEGTISINGTNINEFSLKSLRDSIAIVTQRVYIFNESVAANVAYGKEIDEEKVIDALKRANAYEFIKELPEGIYTKLDESGTNLSGGQRQRIAIARAIYINPKILIMDEATSALDSKSEKKITEAMENLIKDKITFVIAHRLSTVKKADKIIVLKHGKVSAIGTDEELKISSEEYLKLKGLQA